MKALLCFIFSGVLLVGCANVKTTKNESVAQKKEDSITLRTALSEELLMSLDMHKLLEDTINQMLDIQVKQNPSIAPYKPTMQLFFKKYMSYEVLKPEFVKLYAEIYTAEELSDIVAFYKTKTGQKAIKTMPDLMTKGSAIGQMAVQSHLPELTKMIEDQSKLMKGTKN